MSFSRMWRPVVLVKMDVSEDSTASLKRKQTPWPLVRKRTIPTERPPLVGEL
jgi:hypothetical protein